MQDTASPDQLKKQRAILAIIVVSYLMIVVCRRAFKSDHLCALNFDQG